MTALIDRLERAGNVERTDGPTDRRRREVRILPEAIKHKVILDFVLRSTDLSVELH